MPTGLLLASGFRLVYTVAGVSWRMYTFALKERASHTVWDIDRHSAFLIPRSDSGSTRFRPLLHPEGRKQSQCPDGPGQYHCLHPPGVPESLLPWEHCALFLTPDFLPLEPDLVSSFLGGFWYIYLFDIYLVWGCVESLLRHAESSLQVVSQVLELMGSSNCGAWA